MVAGKMSARESCGRKKMSVDFHVLLPFMIVVSFFEQFT